MKCIFTALCICSLFSAASFADQASNKSFNDFVDCSESTAVKYADLQDSADVIAKVSVHSCTPLLINGLKKTPEFKIVDIEKQMSLVRRYQETVEPMAMKCVLDYRLSKITK